MSTLKTVPGFGIAGAVEYLNKYGPAPARYDLSNGRHVWNGEYLHLADKNWSPADTMSFDADGLPLVLHGAEWEYNAVTLAQFGLTYVSRHDASSDAADLALAVEAAEKLLDMQSADGAFRYVFSHSYHTHKLEAGWVSGMAQGQAASLFARLWVATDDERYLDAGRKAIDFMLLPMSAGGTMASLGNIDPSLASLTVAQEAPTTPAYHILNGYLFSVLGLSDWAAAARAAGLPSASSVEAALADAVAAAEALARLSDLDGFTTYDLHGLVTSGARPWIQLGYHATHVVATSALGAVTGSRILADYGAEWLADVRPVTLASDGVVLLAEAPDGILVSNVSWLALRQPDGRPFELPDDVTTVLFDERKIFGVTAFFANGRADYKFSLAGEYIEGGVTLTDRPGVADVLRGDFGDDSFVVSDSGDVVMDAAGGFDRVASGASHALAPGQEIELLTPLSYRSTRAINLTGNEFDQTIMGNAGDNVINGRLGDDILSGGGGADSFVFNTTLNAATNVDRIVDFSVPSDTIQLHGRVFGGLPSGELAASRFNTGAAASEADDRIVYNPGNGALIFDADGVGAAAGIRFAMLPAGLALTGADFVVI